MTHQAEEILPQDANGELVHWMEPKPLTVGPAGMSITAITGFALGVAGAVALLALTHWLTPPKAAFWRRWRLGK
jgi:hypothetical protein